MPSLAFRILGIICFLFACILWFRMYLKIRAYGKGMEGSGSDEGPVLKKDVSEIKELIQKEIVKPVRFIYMVSALGLALMLAGIILWYV